MGSVNIEMAFCTLTSSPMWIRMEEGMLFVICYYWKAMGFFRFLSAPSLRLYFFFWCFLSWVVYFYLDILPILWIWSQGRNSSLSQSRSISISRWQDDISFFLKKLLIWCVKCQEKLPNIYWTLLTLFLLILMMYWHLFLKNEQFYRCQRVGAFRTFLKASCSPICGAYGKIQ